MTAPASLDAPAVRRRPLAAGLIMAVTVMAFEAMAVGTVLPSLSEELDGDRLFGAAFSVFMLASLLALVVSGEVADRRGPAGPFVVGAALFGAGLVVVGLAPTMPVVILGRAFQGAGAGTFGTIAYVAVGRAWPAEARPRLFAWLSAAWIIPSLVGPAAAGAITEAAGWRWAFLGLVPLVPLLVVLAVPSLTALGPPAATGPHPPSRIPDAARLAVGTTLAVVGLQSARLPVVVGLVALGALVAVRALLRLLPEGTFRFAPGVAAVVAARMAVSVAFLGADAFIPLAASRLHDASALQAGAVISGGALLWSLGSFVVARVHGRRQASTLVGTGFTIVAVGLLLTIPVISPDVPLWATFVTWSIAGFGIGLVFTTLSTTGMGLAPAGSEGLVSSQLGIADALGFAVITAVGGALVGLAERSALTLAQGLGLYFAVLVAVAVLGAVCSGRVRPA